MRASWVGLVAGILVAASAHADDTRYADVVVGARAIGVGGAFTAVADDSSGLIYNPAGIVDVKRANLSVSTNLYGFSRRSQGGIFTGLPLTGIPRVASSDLNVIPASAGTVIGLGPLRDDGSHTHAVSFGLHVPSSTQTTISVEEFDLQGNGARRSLRLTDRTLWAGAGYGYRAGDSVRLGVAVHYVLRSVAANDRITAISAQDGGGKNVYDVETDLTLQSGSVVGVAGVKIVPSRHLAFGMSVATQSLQIHHNGAYVQRTLRTAGGGSYDSENVKITEGPLTNFTNVGSRSPWTLRMGAAWIEHANWTLTTDLSVFLPVEYDLVPRDSRVQEGLVPLVTRVRREPVVNGAIGYEKLVGRTFSFSVGGFTNMPSSPAIKSTGGVLDPTSSRLSRIPMVGMTFAAGLLSAFSITRLGFMTAFGVGDLVTVRNRAEAVTANRVDFIRSAASEWTFFVFISTTFRFGEGKSERIDFGLPNFAGDGK